MERQNQGLLKSIQISHSLGRDWKMDLLDYLLMYRSTPHLVTEKTPAELLFGRKIKSRFPVLFENINDVDLRNVDFQNKEKGKKYSVKNKQNEMQLNIGDIVVVKNFCKKSLILIQLNIKF